MTLTYTLEPNTRIAGYSSPRKTNKVYKALSVFSGSCLGASFVDVAVHEQVQGNKIYTIIFDEVPHKLSCNGMQPKYFIPSRIIRIAHSRTGGWEPLHMTSHRVYAHVVLRDIIKVIILSFIPCRKELLAVDLSILNINMQLFHWGT
jgi:hypothetical protein